MNDTNNSWSSENDKRIKEERLMKAEELMLNDWVECLDSTHKTKMFAQVDAIEESRNCLLVKDGWGNWFLDISHLEPIPLTEEFMTKNGFEQKDNLTYVSGQVEIIKHRDNWNVVINKYCVFVDMNIKFVHELQHLLRLVGVEKEFEL